MQARETSSQLLSWTAIFSLMLALATAAKAQTAPATPYEVPIAEAIHRVGSENPVRIRATLLVETGPGYFFAKDDTGTIRGNIADPIGMKPGDLIEITGTPVLYGSGPDAATKVPWLLNCTAANLGPGRLPLPVSMRAAEAYASEAERKRLDSEFVSLHGRVVGFDTFTSIYLVQRKQVRVEYEGVVAEDEGARALVLFPRGTNAADLFPIGTIADFVGACRLEPEIPRDHTGIIHILVPDPSLVRVQQFPPFWEVPAYRRAAGLLAAAGAGLALFITLGLWLHQRKIKLRHAAVRTAELERALQHEQELSRLKSRFVSIVSHEFRTPLGIIGSSAEILERYDGRLSAAQRGEHLRAITENIRRTSRMMEDALALSRMDSGAVKFNPAPLEVRAFCERLCDEMRSATGNKNPIEMDCGDDLNADLPLDEDLLRHILTNLLNNAVKYSAPGEPVRFRARRTNEAVRFDIEDRGIGIPEADRERLFEAFHRAENVGPVRGTGLGLVIAKRCCALHGGDIQFESEEGKGTAFHVTLPLPQPAHERERDHTPD